jgi:glucose-6-phosphate 1-dehydrogenase
MHGDLTLFVRDDELNAAWNWVDPILNAWQNDSEGLKSYIAGSWGPNGQLSAGAARCSVGRRIC